MSQKVSQSLGNTNNWSTEFERRLVLKLKAASSAFERDEEQTAGVATILLTGEKSISQILLRYKIQLWLINTDYGCIITMFAQESGMAKVVNIVQIVMLRNTSEKYC